MINIDYGPTDSYRGRLWDEELIICGVEYGLTDNITCSQIVVLAGQFFSTFSGESVAIGLNHYVGVIIVRYVNTVSNSVRYISNSE